MGDVLNIELNISLEILYFVIELSTFNFISNSVNLPGGNLKINSKIINNKTRYRYNASPHLHIIVKYVS